MDERILNYSPGPSKQARRYRRLVQIILLTGAFAAGYFLIPPSWRWAEFFYWQFNCANYTAPPGRVVLKYDVRGLNPPEIYVNPDESELRHTHGRLDVGIGGTLFMHQMIRPDGQSRLVFVDATGNINVTYEVRTIINFPWQTSQIGPMQNVTFHDEMPAHSTVYAGQLDPLNESHFAFSYDTDGQHHVVDVWLDNNDRLLFSRRSESTASRP